MTHMDIKVLETLEILHPYQNNFPRAEKSSQTTIWQKTKRTAHHPILHNENLLSYFQNIGHLDTFTWLHNILFVFEIYLYSRGEKLSQIPQRITTSENVRICKVVDTNWFTEKLYQLMLLSVE